MTSDHPRFAQWDSAYVLGALSPTERNEYEEHLATCQECQRSVAELTPMPGLLARLSSERGIALLETTDAPTPAPEADLVDRLVRTSRVRSIRRIRIWMTAAAATLILIAGILVSLGRPDSQSIALEPTTDAQISATVTLTPVGWGTRIELDCTYEGTAADAPEQGWPYALYVTGDDGSSNEVSSWRASPGKTARLEAGTAVDLGDIAMIEIRAVGSDTTLMRGTPTD